MRKLFLIAVPLLLCTAAAAQAPELTVDGKTNNGVYLQTLKAEVKVCGTVARTTWTMTFKNTTPRILEGNLNFPLKDGLTISRYALDINGNLREAVPVDRGRGTEVFEAIERRRVDPGLLEKLDGNTFRTRIYPISPNSTRTVLIGYEEQLAPGSTGALQYHLPLNLKDTVDVFSLSISVIQSAQQPVFNQALTENMQFTRSSSEYNASLHKTRYVPGQSLSFSIPQAPNTPAVMLQDFENKYCFLVNLPMEYEEKEKLTPGRIGLLWDASLSGLTRNTKKELALLDALFKKLNNVTVTCIVFSNTVKSRLTFTVQNGDWQGLQRTLERLVYDGATNPGCLNLNDIAADEFLLVSDGKQTLGSREIQLSRKPVYCISSAVAADYSNLKYIAGKTGGMLLDLQTENLATALAKLTTRPLRFLGIRHDGGVKEYYPSLPVPVSGSFAVAGMAEYDAGEITLLFGYGSEPAIEKTVELKPDEQLCENFDITRVFAQKKIAELDIRYNQNRQQIEQLGRQYGIVTRNTSLIVLETLNDYIQYRIEPPAELRKEYDHYMKQQSGSLITQTNEGLNRSLQMMTALQQWYNTAGTADNPAVPAKDGGTMLISGTITDRNGDPLPGVNVVIKGTTRGTSTDAKGSYRIRAARGNTLRMAYVGFEQKEVWVGDNTIINISLQQSPHRLAEVVVTAPRNTRKLQSVTNSQTVQDEAVPTAPAANISDALAGKVSGAQVAGASTTVTVRGENSIAAGSNPLYVVDGTAVSGRPDIKPDDMDDMSILPGSTATAIFGAEGARGAVVITTKQYKAAAGNRDIQAKIDSAKAAEQPAADMRTYDYMKAIRQTEKTGRYAAYLNLRQYYTGNPVYFFEAGGYFIKTGDKATGLTILSNLAEMENSNYELYKMLGYKLKEAGDYDGELSAFKKVLELRPLDPQSYRDCALAHLDLGQYQQALDMLYEGLTRSYSSEMGRMYKGIEEIFLVEINRLISLHRKSLKLKQVDERLISSMPAAVRVVMNWNKNNTDIDLWVTDPNGEKCYYGNQHTRQGGRISDDFTEGFGPEQFILKNAAKGKYRIEINYYGDTQVTLAGPATIMAELYLHYGTEKEERKIITLQMTPGRQGTVFIGELEL